MSNAPLKILLVDQGKNTGLDGGSKIGGGQIARRRFFSNMDLFDVTLLTSEKELGEFWADYASNIIFAPELQTYRPTRTKVARNTVQWRRLFREGRKAAILLSGHLQKTDYDVIYFNDTKSRLLYILALMHGRCWRLKGQTAIEVDGEWILGIYDFLMKNLYLLFFDKIVCPTHAVKKRLGPLRHIYKHKLFAAYPGVDLPDDYRAIQNTCPEEKIVTFGCIGTLRIESKAQDLVIKAVDLLVKKYDAIPAKILFFGDGPDREILEKMVQDKGLESYFEFKGYITKQEAIYGQIDACIMPSKTETASIVIMESLIRNIPVISSNLPACQEILSHFQGGVAFKQGDYQDLAAKLDHVLESDLLQEIRDRLAKSDKKIITKDYQAKRVFDFLSCGPKGDILE